MSFFELNHLQRLALVFGNRKMITVNCMSICFYHMVKANVSVQNDAMVLASSESELFAI